jgi:hypothetical protein
MMPNKEATAAGAASGCRDGSLTGTRDFSEKQPIRSSHEKNGGVAPPSL